MSEQTRHLLSYDMSPDAGTSIEGGSERPVSPTPPTDDNLTPSQVILRTSIGGEIIDSPMSDDMGMIPPGDLYTHQEVDEEDENSKASNDRPDSVDCIRSKAAKNRFSGSFADSASTSSSLQEFERLETEVLKSSSLTGTPKKFVKLGTDTREDESTSSLPELGNESCQKSSAPQTSGEKSQPPMDQSSLLSEIEEGHESQASDSGETVTGTVDEASNDESDEANTDNQIDSIIRELTQTTPMGEEGGRKKGEEGKKGEGKILIAGQSQGERGVEMEESSSSVSGQRALLSRRGFSTESSDSHARSSISTTNTDSLQARMMELDRDLMDSEERQTPDTISLGREEEEDYEMRGDEDYGEQAGTLDDDQVTPIVPEKPFPESLEEIRDPSSEETSTAQQTSTDRVTHQHQVVASSSSCMLASTDSLDLGLMTSSFMSTTTMISSSETIEVAPPTEPKLLSTENGTKEMLQNLPSSSDSSSASDNINLKDDGNKEKK